MGNQFTNDQIEIQKGMAHQIRIRDEAIKKLQAQLDADKWISVDDRLPEVGVPVLIHAPQLKVGFIVGMIDSDYVDGVWFFPDEDDSMKFKYGKFWQPLPEPPAQEPT